ncbi:MAG: argininosuccinate synthase [Nitrososphaerota archaeon]|nr:argininosuccinate synthase [Candidatus Bathyarchaeota archaeon]MDW8049098.1 argininosuccinate synthase [Nitrososphaerota archaeon]
MAKKVVLAYSGGLDTSVMIKWLQQKLDADVITVTLDVGQKEDLEEIKAKALSLGVLKHYSIDAKEEFARRYVLPAIKANALYEGKYPLSTALSRPLIAEKLVEVAHEEGAKIVAHGCTGKGNDQVRIEVSVKALDPSIDIFAPVREWGLTRDAEIEFAKANNIPIPVDLDRPYSIDQNLWGRSVECGVLEHPEKEPPEDAYEWTSSPEKAPEKPEYLSIEFYNGTPEGVNGERMDPVSLIERVNEIAGRHGVGRIDHIEDRLVGIKSREVYECPAATVIIEAHKDLEKMVLTRHELQFKQQVDSLWAYLVYTGLWMDPLREDLDAFIDKTQERVCGTVKVKVYKGNAQVVGRSSPFSLYDINLATYDVGTTFNQASSAGFIELWGLPTRVANAIKRMKRK